MNGSHKSLGCEELAGEWCKGGCQGNKEGLFLARAKVEVRPLNRLGEGRYTGLQADPRLNTKTIVLNDGIYNSLRG
ncbi:unnamed protein product [Linum tenue]|uniref:Uncharacterized protein n=1 Tax=Linum tenue TaxID=586396 RepID=A0AAV0JDX5_9ROSI|nr:unnamed protein product [Linum tenue]